jgi:hypothetical protein
MSAERFKVEKETGFVWTPDRARESASERVEMTQTERERLAAEHMIQLVVMRAKEVYIEDKIRAANYIKEHKGTWNFFKPKVCDVVDDWIEDGVWRFVFKFTTDGPDDGCEVEEKIPLGG